MSIGRVGPEGRPFITALLKSVAVGAALSCAPPSRGAILYEDTMYWRPGGITELNPAVPPLDAYVKIQETVYDDAQGRVVLGQQLAFGLIHGNGGVIPAAPMNLYAYSITNLTYGNGPFTGVGAGIGGFHIPNPANVPFVMYGPNNANDWWHENTASPDFEWQIDKNANNRDGDGVGILVGQTHNSIYFDVPDGTPHGFIPMASVNTWTGGGLDEELPPAVMTDFVTGFVSGPVPEPTTLATASLAGAVVFMRRRRVSRA